MTNPVTALLLAVGVVALGLLLFWPRWGLIAYWRYLRRASTRVLSEDALKHIYKSEVEGKSPDLDGLAGKLGISADDTAELIETMVLRDLVNWRNNRLQLTPDGRTSALHIIRAHRLWERYLADETGLDQKEWHAKAERQEHTLSPSAADDLSRLLGQPTHDPHGDPIPAADSERIRHGGEPLTAIDENELVRIVHVEDEPETIYAQLVAEGLAPGMELRVLEKTPQLIRFWTEGDERVLAPILANNVSVVPLEEDEPSEAYTGERLSDLEPGDRGRVTAISRACRGSERRRLLDLGLTPDTVVTAEFKSPGGDPTAFRIRGAVIALRREQTELIHIERLESEVDHDQFRKNVSSESGV